MGQNFRIRKLQESDIRECAELMVKTNCEPPVCDGWESPDQAAVYLTELVGNPVFLGFVIVSDHRIVGACFGHLQSWYEGKQFLMDEFFIDLDEQRLGIGSMLMIYIKEYLKARDIHSILILTQRNNPAETFFRNHGFQVNSNAILMYSFFEDPE